MENGRRQRQPCASQIFPPPSPALLVIVIVIAFLQDRLRQNQERETRSIHSSFRDRNARRGLRYDYDYDYEYNYNARRNNLRSHGAAACCTLRRCLDVAHATLRVNAPTTRTDALRLFFSGPSWLIKDRQHPSLRAATWTRRVGSPWLKTSGIGRDGRTDAVCCGAVAAAWLLT